MKNSLPRSAAAALLLSISLAGCSSCSKTDASKYADAGVLADAAVDVVDAAAADDAGAVDESAMPATTVSDDLQQRMRHLFEAITQDNADLATDALFPRDGYIAARDTADPQTAWDRKVSGAFHRAVERTHKRMKGIEHGKFLSFELGHAMQQVAPKKKDFKKPLWRVKHSKLSFTIDGKTRHLDIAEMTAWRGNWYITRLR